MISTQHSVMRMKCPAFVCFLHSFIHSQFSRQPPALSPAPSSSPPLPPSTFFDLHRLRHWIPFMMMRMMMVHKVATTRNTKNMVRNDSHCFNQIEYVCHTFYTLHIVSMCNCKSECTRGIFFRSDFKFSPQLTPQLHHRHGKLTMKF